MFSFIFCKDDTVELGVQGDVLGKISADSLGRNYSTHVVECAGILVEHINLNP